MFSHVTVGTKDATRAGAFYDAVLATLGISEFYRDEAAIGYGAEGQPGFWVLPPFNGKPMHPGNGTHTAFNASSRAEVDAFYQAALTLGGSGEGAPGLRPQYHEHYYGAYVRDPDGNKLQAVCHLPE